MPTQDHHAAPVGKRHGPATHLRVAVVLAVVLATALAFSGLLHSGSGRALSLASDPFRGATLTDPTRWVLTTASGSDAPCLTARSSQDPPITLDTGSIAGCTPTPDGEGDGVLRLTANKAGQGGAIEYARALPTTAGIDVTFTIAAWGGSPGADGMAFYLRNGQTDGYRLGGSGAGLGYLPSNGFSPTGLPGALLAVGFDANGAFSNDDAIPGGVLPVDCPRNPGDLNDTIAIRGGDTSTALDGSTGYCLLEHTAAAAEKPTRLDRATGTRTVRIVIDPVGTTDRRISVFASPWGSTTVPDAATLQHALPAEYLAASSFRFGWSASTGGRTNHHELWGFGLQTAGDPCAVVPSTSAGETTTTVYDCTAAWATSSTTTSTTTTVVVPTNPSTAPTTTSTTAPTTSTSTTAPTTISTSTTSTVPGTVLLPGITSTTTSPSTTTSVPPPPGPAVTSPDAGNDPDVTVLGATVTTSLTQRPLALTGSPTNGLAWQGVSVLLLALAALALSRAPLERRHRGDEGDPHCEG